VPPGAVSSGALVAAASGFDGRVPAPDAFTVGQVGKLAGDLLAVWLVLPAELLVGGGCCWWLGVEEVLRVLLQQRIDGGAGAEVAGFG